MLTSSLVATLAFVFAFSGILYEYLLAYYITGVQGGGYAVLFLTFSFFAAFLGLGASLYNFLPNRFRKLSSLGILQIILALLVGVMPRYFETLNSLSTAQGPGYYTLLMISLIPVSLIGAVTGFELPFLYGISRSRISKILFWDYLGMFSGIIIFPYLLTRYIPYSQMMYALGALGFFIGIFLLFADVSDSSDGLEISRPQEKKTRHIPLWMGLCVTFLLSFCSFSYQGLIGKVVISILGDNHFVQAYAIGFFIVGMALGALIVDSVAWLRGAAGPLLFKIETGVCIIAGLTPVALYFLGGTTFLFEGTFFFFSEQTFLILGSFVFSIFSFLVGVLTGTELPMVFRWLGLGSDDRDSYWLIAANYSAAIFAGVLVTFLLPKYLGHSFSFILIIIVNMLAMILIASRDTQLSFKVKIYAAALILFAVFINANYVQRSRQFFLDTYYSKFSLPHLDRASLKTTLTAINALGKTQRIESFYQNIDLRTTEEHTIEGQEHSFSLYLNKQPQFNSEIFRNYHQSMSLAARSFLKVKPGKILILGGGDGLLAGELLKSFPKSEIKLVELDPVMIDLALNNSRFVNLNEGALESPRVRVQVGDAYSFVRRTEEKYDLVFVDFPYPTSVDLARLYSLEFYSGLRRVLTEEGVAIIDAPILVNYRDSQRVSADKIVEKILSTMIYAGFKRPFCFGPFDPFVAVAKDDSALFFSDEVLDSANNTVFVNLRSLHQSLGEIHYDERLVNKVLAPTILEM